MGREYVPVGDDSVITELSPEHVEVGHAPDHASEGYGVATMRA
jgi:hypothetical protein